MRRCFWNWNTISADEIAKFFEGLAKSEESQVPCMVDGRRETTLSPRKPSQTNRNPSSWQKPLHQLRNVSAATQNRIRLLIKLFTFGVYYLSNICMIKAPVKMFRQLVLGVLFNLIYNCNENGTVSNLAFLRGGDKAYLFLFYFETFTSVCRKCAFFSPAYARLYRKSGWYFFCAFA